MIELAGLATLGERAATLHTLCTDITRLYRLSGPAVGGFARYELLLVPWLWRLRLGARLTPQASGLTVECPGTIRVQAAQKRMVGPSHTAYEMNAAPRPTPFDEDLVLRWPMDGSPISHRRFEIVRADGSAVRGQTDAQGRTGLQKSQWTQDLLLRLLD